MSLSISLRIPGKIAATAIALGALALAGGCSEVNTAVDQLLGRNVQLASTASKLPPGSGIGRGLSDRNGFIITAQAEKTPERVAQKPGKPGPADKKGADQKVMFKGKKRAPGQLAPATKAAEAEREAQRLVFDRDPFNKPTEVLPSECPPSMPLCRFDRSQLKLVGVIQVAEGGFKGMVEDPDGRGYFITPGMQIGGATVTQVTGKGVMLHDHKTRQDVPMPLFKNVPEGAEF